MLHDEHMAVLEFHALDVENSFPVCYIHICRKVTANYLLVSVKWISLDSLNFTFTISLSINTTIKFQQGNSKIQFLLYLGLTKCTVAFSRIDCKFLQEVLPRTRQGLWVIVLDAENSCQGKIYHDCVLAAKLPHGDWALQLLPLHTGTSVNSAKRCIVQKQLLFFIMKFSLEKKPTLFFYSILLNGNAGNGQNKYFGHWRIKLSN